MGALSILQVDTDAARASALASSIRSYLEPAVIVSRADRASALEDLSRAPDIMLLHADVLKRYGLVRFLSAVRERSAATRVIVLFASLPGDERIIETVLGGARGILLAAEQASVIAKAVRAVAAGEIWTERRILEKAISAGRTFLPGNGHAQVPELDELTDRERDMLNQVLKGATNREIAQSSNISERTVKTHLYRVYRKLHVKSRAKAIALLSH